jgi:hypothetical protein
MKHLQQFEKRSYNSYKKYIDFLAQKFGANAVIIYNENKYNVKIIFSYSHSIRKGYLERLYETFKFLDFIIGYNHNAVTFEVSNVTKEILDQFELEFDAKKYNL